MPKQNGLNRNKEGTDIASSQLQSKGWFSDGRGLYLKVVSPGRGGYLYRHRGVWRGLGSTDGVTYSEARAAADDLWRLACKGGDPIAKLDAERAAAILTSPGKTFGDVLEKYLAKKMEAGWSESNRDRELRDHRRTFNQMPALLATPIKAVNAEVRTAALDGLESKAARRKARSWISGVMKYHETGEMRLKADAVEHYAAMPAAEVPAFYAKLGEIGSADARGLQFLILTCCRSDEITGASSKGKVTKAPATWREIESIDGRDVWVIPPERAPKGSGLPHYVVLTPQAMATLGARGADDAKLFDVSSVNAFRNLMQGMKPVPHGFRSTFEDFAIEAGHDENFVHRMTGHDKRGKVQKAYQRSELLAKRATISKEWADYVSPNNGGANA